MSDGPSAGAEQNGNQSGMGSSVTTDSNNLLEEIGKKKVSFGAVFTLTHLP